MKPIKSIMVLVVSIGCWLPGVAVRAEAPTPKGGCWSREVAMRPTDDPCQNLDLEDFTGLPDQFAYA